MTLMVLFIIFLLVVGVFAACNRYKEIEQYAEENTDNEEDKKEVMHREIFKDIAQAVAVVAITKQMEKEKEERMIRQKLLRK